MSSLTSESTPFERKLKSNNKSSSQAETKPAEPPKSSYERFNSKNAVYKSLDFQIKSKLKENLELSEEKKENFADFAKEEVRLNTFLQTEECASLLTSPTPMKGKNKLPPLKVSGVGKSRDFRENNDNAQALNPKKETYEILRRENSKMSMRSSEFMKNPNEKQKKEPHELEKSEDRGDFGENNEKLVGFMEIKEDPVKRNSTLRIPIMNFEDFLFNSYKTRRGSTRSGANRHSRKKRSFFKGLFKSWTNKIFPDRETNEGMGQETIFKNADETYSYGVLAKISQAVSKFKSFVRFKKIESLEPTHHSIINDWCWYGEKKHEGDMMESEINMISFHKKIIIRIAVLAHLILKKLTCLSKCAEYLYGLGDKVKVFNPKSRFKLTWDLVNMIIIFWNFLNISTALCFGETIENVFLLGKANNARQLYYFFIFVSFLDMGIDNLFTLNTSFYEMGALVNSRKRIFRNYLRNNLLIDLIAEIPFFVQLINYESDLSSFSQRYLNCLFFLKYYNLKNVFKVLEEFLALDDKYEAAFHLFKLILKVYFVAHILACLWHTVAYFKSDPEAKTWISYKCLEKGGDWTERYIYSIYFALTTMSTVGYGDIIPQNQEECAVAMLSMFVGSGMFGYALNNIGELLKRMHYKEDQLKKEIRSLDRFMKSKDIDYELQSRARKYLEYVWNEEKDSQKNEEEILDKLSHTLREEVFLQSHGKILKQHPILFKNFSEITMRKLIHLIHPVRYSPEERIVKEGDQSLNGYFYMITQGEIALSLAPQRRDERNCTVRLLKAGDSFGEISFFTDLPQDFTAISLYYSTIYRLKKSDFLSVISESSDDWEIFCMMRDKYLLYEDVLEFHMKCWSCSDNHPFKKCPALRYSPLRYKVIIEHQKKIEISKRERKSLARPRRNFRFHALRGKKIVNSKSLPWSKVEISSKANFDEGQKRDASEPDPKTSLEINLDNYRRRKESLVQDGSKAILDEVANLRRNSAQKPAIWPDASPHVGIRKGTFKAEPDAKEKEANHNIAAPNELQSHVELISDASNIAKILPDNRDEMFMMCMDQTKNLSRKKKKQSNALPRKSKRFQQKK